MALTRRKLFAGAAGAAVAIAGGKALKAASSPTGQPIAPTGSPVRDTRTPEEVLAHEERMEIERAEKCLEPSKDSYRWVEYMNGRQRKHLKKLATERGIPFTSRPHEGRAEIIFIHNRVISGYIPG